MGLSESNSRKTCCFTNKKGAIFHKGNAQPYVSVITFQKLKGFIWDFLNHPPYFPDRAPSYLSISDLGTLP